MSNKKVAAFGIFSTSGAVDGATDALVKRGFPAVDIAVRFPPHPPTDPGAGILLSVHCNTAVEIELCKEIMGGSGAEDVSSTGESGIETQRMDRAMVMVHDTIV